MQRPVVMGVLLAGLAAAQNAGIPPRSAATDYPAQTSMKSATLAALIVPPDQVRKMFSADVSRHYVVVEVAAYPDHSFDIDRFYFSLKTGTSVSHAERPRDAAQSWPERKGPLGDRGPSVTNETGVVYQRTHDPVNGTRSGVGAYEGVAVSDRDPRPPINDPGPSAQIEQKLQEQEVPMGPTRKAVAGYLYFPQYSKKHKGDTIELEYSRDDESANLRFPAK